MKRIFLLLSVFATLGVAGCCCCHGNNDCIDDCYSGGYGGGYGQGCDCPQGCDGHHHRHCRLFHHKRSRDCQEDGNCQVDGQLQGVDGYPVEQRCQADRGCKLKNRRTKGRKSCPHCGREFAGGISNAVSPCCGETMIGDGCSTDCGVMQTGCSSCGCDCGQGCSTGMPMSGNCPNGNCGAAGGCATGNCGTTAPTPASTPGTSAMSHPYDELQALQAAGWSIVPTPGSTTTGTSSSSGGMEPIPAPPSAMAPPVPVRPAGAR